MSKEKFTKVCPNCKSTNVQMDTTNPLQPAMGLPTMYICNQCKHSNQTFPEVALSELENFENLVDKKQLRDTIKDQTPLVDNSYGIFEVQIIWKLLAPIFVIIGLIMIGKFPVIGILSIIAGLFMAYITFFKIKKKNN